MASLHAGSIQLSWVADLMADLSITPANVALAGTGVVTQSVQVAVAVAQGETGYLDVASGKYRLADANLSEAAAGASGMFLTPAGIDGYALIAFSGPINVGATLTVGVVYVQSANAGKIAPIGDLTTGDYVTILGVASAANRLDLAITRSGAQVP